LHEWKIILFTPELIEEKFRSVLADSKFELVELKIQGGSGNPKFVVKLDHRERDIQISELEKYSRLFEEELDMSDDISRKYALDVTSPGVGHPLNAEWEFAKNVGRELLLILKPSEPGEKKQEVKSKLTGISDGFLSFENGESVSLESIEHAKVKLPW